MKIGGIFEEVAKQMRSDFDLARKAMTHPGLKGASFEESFRTFLREYLPKSLDVSTGILVDAQGGISCQLDVIISDAAKTPIFFKNGETRVIPVECAYAVIEIKAKLDARELRKAFKNMKSVRDLKKTAYVKDTGPIMYTSYLYGKEWEIWPINYFVFAYDGIDMKKLAMYVGNTHFLEKLPEHSRIDAICILDKGVIYNQLEDGKLDALPGPGSITYYTETPRALLLFYTLISRYFNQARLPNFNFTDYISEIKF